MNRVPVFTKVTVKAGEKYEFTSDVHCRDGGTLPKNSVLKVVRKTKKAPYGEIGPNNWNWVCKADNGETVWSTLESCIERGLLRKLRKEKKTDLHDPSGKIRRNRAKCLRCKQTIESKTRHDWVQCKCGNIFVDGGRDYLRRGYKSNEWKEMSEVTKPAVQ